MAENHRSWGTQDAMWWPDQQAIQHHHNLMQQQIAQQQQIDAANSSASNTQQPFSYKMASSFENLGTNVTSSSPVGAAGIRGYDYRPENMAGGSPTMSMPAPAAQWWYPPSNIDSMQNTLQNLQNSMQHSIQQQQQNMPPAHTPPPSQSEAQSRQEEAQRHHQQQDQQRQQQDQQRQHQDLERQHQDQQRQHQDQQRQHQQHQDQSRHHQQQQDQQRHQEQQRQHAEQAIQQHHQAIAEAQARQQQLHQQVQQLHQQVQQQQHHQLQNQNNHHQAHTNQHQSVLQQHQQIANHQPPAPVKGRMPRGKGADARPRGRMTAYAFFVQTCREEHKKKHPEENVIFAEFSKKCAERWKTMVDKEKKRFHEMAETDKKRYDTEMQSYTPPKGEKVRGKKRKQVKDPNAPKRSLSAFFWFSHDERGKVKAANPEYGVGDIAKELGRRWADADPSLKGKFEAMADEDKARYEKEMTAYKKKNNPALQQPVPVPDEEEPEEDEEIEEDEDE